MGSGLKMKMKKHVFEGVLVAITKARDDVLSLHPKIIANEDTSMSVERWVWNRNFGSCMRESPSNLV